MSGFVGRARPRLVLASLPLGAAEDAEMRLESADENAKDEDDVVFLAEDDDFARGAP